MCRLPLALAAVVLNGCGLLFPGGTDQLVPIPEAGPDAPDAAVDGGGPVDGCVGTAFETDCSDGVDNDCDQLTDCADYDCSRSTDNECCRGSGTSLGIEPFGALWRDLGDGSNVTVTDGRITSFGPGSRPGAYQYEDCVPLGFGADFEIVLYLISDCGADCGENPDLASFALTSVQTIGSDRVASELSFLLRADGSAAVERGGRVIAETDVGTFSENPIEGVRFSIQLRPGVTEDGNQAIFVSADVDQTGSANIEILPQTFGIVSSDLLEGCRGASGLFPTFEGIGNDVHVSGRVEGTQLACANPGEFDRGEPLDLESPMTPCAAGGLGAPALTNFCYGECSSRRQWEWWADGAPEEDRRNEDFTIVDFDVCAAGQREGEETVPTFRGPLEMPGGETEAILRTGSVREPFVAYNLSRLYVAWAAAADGSDQYAIHFGRVTRFPFSPSAIEPVAEELTPAMVEGCRSLRDPALLLPTEEGDIGWLLFTCEPDTGFRSIGAATLALSGAEVWEVQEVVTDFLTQQDVGEYGRFGVFGPEPILTEVPVEGGDPVDHSLRLWFMTRSEGGVVRLSYAQGRGPISAGLPEVVAYPGNPVLSADDAVFLSPCEPDCALSAAAVAEPRDESGFYHLLVARSRRTEPEGWDHELVPLLQPIPLQ